MTLLNKLERKFGRYAIDNLMMIVCAGQAMVFIVDLISDGMASGMLALVWDQVAKGEVWRCLSFVFVPSTYSILNLALSLYFYYLVGGALENEWGTFNFNCYYFLSMLCCNIAAAISGYSSSYYVNLTLFLAFALLYPEYTLNLFYLIPVKAKWLALIDFLYFLYIFIRIPSSRWTILFSLLPVALFFWRSGVRTVKREINRYKARRMYRSNWK